MAGRPLLSKLSTLTPDPFADKSPPLRKENLIPAQIGWQQAIDRASAHARAQGLTEQPASIFYGRLYGSTPQVPAARRRPQPMGYPSHAVYQRHRREDRWRTRAVARHQRLYLHATAVSIAFRPHCRVGRPHCHFSCWACCCGAIDHRHRSLGQKEGGAARGPSWFGAEASAGGWLNGCLSLLRSKCEELRLSKPRPLCRNERTSVRSSPTSQVGQKRT